MILTRLDLLYQIFPLSDYNLYYTTYVPGNACYRCVFDGPPVDGTVPSAAEAGILGAAAGVIGSIQAAEAVKYLTGIGGLILNRILLFDAGTMTFHSLKATRNDRCDCCSPGC